jgi:tRNA-Thr(GGU) m(6)t(6)A37 methyltransferase TsaA
MTAKLPRVRLGCSGRVTILASVPVEAQRMRHIPLFAVLAIIPGPLFIAGTLVSAETPPSGKQFVVRPIGSVTKADGKTTIVLEKRYEPGLLGLEGFSHVYVYWWFDRNDTPEKRAILQVHPMGNAANPLTGVFATRSPVRPNLIAMTLCKVISVKDNVIEIDGIDAFAGTPVLDIKPYIPRIDCAPSATAPGWLRKK